MKPAIALLWSASLRSSLRRFVILGLITALGGGICLGVAAGARRTGDAYTQVAALSNVGELGSSYVAADPNDVEGATQLLGAIPEIASFSIIVGFQVFLPETDIAGLTAYAMYSGPDRDRPIVLAGRLPDTSNEVFINEAIASTGVSIGDQLAALIVSPDFSEFLPETLQVVGVGLFNDEVYLDETGIKPALVFSGTFVADHRGLALWQTATFSLRPDGDRAEVVAQLLEQGVSIDDDRAADISRADDAIRPLVITLWTLSLLAGIATIILVGQGLHRDVRRSAPERRGLLAVGLTRSSVLMADVAVAATVGLVGAGGAVGVAVSVSPLFPQGRARRIGALRGLDVDEVTLISGALALTIAICSTVAFLAWKSARSGDSRPGTVPPILGNTPAASTGVRFATGRRGLFGTVATSIIGLTPIVAGVVFISSMNELIHRPELAGFSWDLIGRDTYASIDTTSVADQLHDAPGLKRLTGLTFVDATVAGEPIPGSVWLEIKGSPWPPIINGRAPAEANEVLIGPKTLRALGLEIGDSMTVGFEEGAGRQGTTLEVTIVGTVVSPSIGIAGSDTPRLNEGLLFRSEDIVGRVGDYGGAVLFDLDSRSNPAAIVASFPDGLPDEFGVATEWFESAEPVEIAQAESASKVLILAMIALAVGVVAAVCNNLLAFVRERRNAFAVLKVVGFTPRQIRATVLWQSGTVLALALVVALPAGLFSGRWLYQHFANGIGVIASPSIAVAALLTVLVGTVLLVQGTALLPALQARRTPAASELRSE